MIESKVDLTIKGDIEALRLEPGDVVVLTVDEPLGEDVALALRQQWQEASGLSNQCVVLSGATVTKLSPTSTVVGEKDRRIR